MRKMICGLLAATAIGLFHAGASAQVATDVVCSNCVDTTDIAVGAVNSARIANGEVKAVDIAPNAVTSAHIMDGQVKAQDLAIDAVTSGRIKNGEVKAVDIANNAITSAHILDGQVKTQDLANGAVAAAKLGIANTIFIEDSGGATANCNDLLAALAAITDNAAEKPYVIVLGPGVYDCGNTPVQMKVFVDIQGSGQGVTLIQGNLNSTTVGVVELASNTELRFSTVRNYAAAGNAMGISANAVSEAKVLHVTAQAPDNEFAFNAGLIVEGNANVTVHSSELIGQHSLYVSTGTANVVSSLVSIATGGGTIRCVGSYDEAYTALSASCN